MERNFEDKSSLGYQLLLNNFMMYIPEKEKFWFPDPCVTDMISMIGKKRKTIEF